MTKLTKDNFETEVMQATVPVLVDFYADWCMPCNMLAPILGELDAAYEGRAKICKVNVDEEQELAKQYGVRNIPALMFFKEGAVAGSMMGLQNKTTLEDKLNTLM